MGMIEMVWESQVAYSSSVEQAMDHVQELMRQAAYEQPFVVQIQASATTCLLVVVGGTISHLEYYDEHQSPRVVGSRGPWESDEEVAFLHQGVPSVLKKRYCIPMEAAYEAIQSYLSTRRRPEHIHWHDTSP